MSHKHDDVEEERIDSAHDLAHELAERLLSCIDSFVAEKGSKEAVLPVILLATEIPASVSRRLCRDAGMLREGVTSLRSQASKCALAYYDERATIAKSEKLDVGLEGFVIKPGGEYQH